MLTRREVLLLRAVWLMIAVGCSKELETVDTDVVVEMDADRDGFPASEDCDDRDRFIYPGAEEICDNYDEDCDGVVDDNAVDAPTFWADVDEDGYGDPVASVVTCDRPAGTETNDLDCDDGDRTVHPGALEICNDLDDDCDGGVDIDPSDGAAGFVDGDGDGYGSEPAIACADAGLVAIDGDCDDTRAAVSPAGTEVCDNGLDDDCSSATPCRLSGVYVDPETSADVAWSFVGRADGAETWAAWAGDVDGDGFEDAAFGGPWGAYAGVSLVWGGATLTGGALPAALTQGRPSSTTVVDGGDVDGDGFSDVLLAVEHDAWVVWGSATRPAAGDLSGVGASFSGSSIEDVAFIGDLDGDARGDWLVGDHGAASRGVWLLFGSATRSTSAPVTDVAAGGQIGGSDAWFATSGTVGGGDIDADGLADMVVCAADTVDASGGGSWALSLVYGSSSRPSGTWTMADADARFGLEGYPGVYTACDAEVLGDVDGDGRGELAFALNLSPASVVLWSPEASRWIGEADIGDASAVLAGDLGDLETRVAGGDLDGDGHTDLAVSMPWAARYAGVAVLYGAEGFGGTYSITTDADARILGSLGYGTAVSLDLGDGDGDGHDDLLGMSAASLEYAWLLRGSGQ